jgi:hypothetical protein
VKALFLTSRLGADLSALPATMPDLEIFRSYSVKTAEFELFFADLGCDGSFSTSLSASGISPAFRGGDEGGNSDPRDDGGSSFPLSDCCLSRSDFSSSRSPQSLKSCSLTRLKSLGSPRKLYNIRRARSKC